MASLLLIQLTIAVTPALIGLAIAAICSPRWARLALRLFQFDLTGMLLLMMALAAIFATNRAIVHLHEEVRQEYLRDRVVWEARYNIPYSADYSASYEWVSFQSGVLIFSSVFITPALIFARLLIDGYRDECRCRSQRRKQMSGVNVQAACDPEPARAKPQWID